MTLARTNLIVILVPVAAQQQPELFPVPAHNQRGLTLCRCDEEYRIASIHVL